MLDPRSIMLAMPCADGRMMSETAGFLISMANRFGAVSFPAECSIIQIARNTIADNFLSSRFEWLVCQDSDVAASPEDYRLLLEPCDGEAEYFNPEEPEAILKDAGAPPRPSRVIVSQLNDPEPGRALDFNSRVAGSADMLVCAQYSYKNDSLEPVQLGFGFVRIHRSVFEVLQKLEHPKNPAHAELTSLAAQMREDADGLDPNGRALVQSYANKIELNLPDPGGGPRLWQGSYKGRIVTDYFPTGPMLSQFVPTAQWKGEDHGFFTLCHMAGIIPRIETRTRLTHIGRKGYPYNGPGYGGGQ